uniref:Protein OS-9 n=1 Tax=Ascaris suum TaxID=6253 RepID=F1KSW5_ASCSU
MIIRQGRDLVCSLLVLPVCFAVINIKELNDVLYDVSLEGVPAGFEHFTLDASVRSVDDVSLPEFTIEENADTILMASAFGQRFVCSLPSVDHQRSIVDDSTVILNVQLVAEVVAAAFYAHNCIRKNLGWWTYELCYGKHIEQLHLEGSDSVGTVLSLGHFVGNLPLPNFVPKVGTQLYFEQHYADGSECDITHKSRSSTVRFICDELLTTSEAYIDTVYERSSCDYVLTVRTGSLCKLSAFLPVGRPQTALMVLCRPALDHGGAMRYVRSLITDQQNRKEKSELIEHLVAKADSIQRQRFARKRTTFNTPRAKHRAMLDEKRLRKQFDDLMKLASRLNADLEGVTYADVQVFDDIHEMEGSYASDEDEDRANLYWYFMDRNWDRKFFPMNIAYVRARNAYYTMMSKFLQRMGMSFDYQMFTYEHFLRNIDTGEIEEKELRIFFGSTLTEAFREESIPGIADFMQPQNFDMNDYWYDIMWLHSNVLKEHLEIFENEVLENVLNGIRYVPEDVMSKVARQILHINTLLRKKEKRNEHYMGQNYFSFVKAEEIYFKFEEAFNRAIKRYDKRTQIAQAQFYAKHVLSRGEMISWMDMIHPEELNATNARLLIKSTKAEKQGSDVENAEMLRIIELRTKGKSTSEREALRNKLLKEAEERAAKERMIARARRPNLRKKVEEYLRRPSDEYVLSRLKSKPSGFLDSDSLKKQLDEFKRSVEKKIRETGLAEEGVVKIEIFAPREDGEGTLSSLAFTEDDGQTNEALKMLLAEQDRIDAEMEHQNRLWNAYTFGATREQKHQVEQVESEDHQDELIVSRLIPILKRAWLL